MTPAFDSSNLEDMLTRLRLSTIRDNLNVFLEEVARQKMPLEQSLKYLCAQELTRRNNRRITMAMKIAHFPCVRTLEGFNFEAQPSVDKAQIQELAACRWIANSDSLLFLGPPGVGKTHLAVALGRQAVTLGYSTLFVSAVELIAKLVQAQKRSKLEEELSKYAKPKLLIIDELGYLPLERDAGHLFFQLVSRRYERGSILITGNRGPGEWGDIFNDPVLAAAILDRLLHHNYCVIIRGDSYRLKDRRSSDNIQKSENDLT